MKPIGRLQLAALFGAASVLWASIGLAQMQTDWDEVMLYRNDVDVRCSEDWLNPTEAIGRVEWSIKYFPATIAQYYSFVTMGTRDYVQHFETLDVATNSASTEWLKLQSGVYKKQPKFPLWKSAQQPEWRAPISGSASGWKPDDGQIRAVCRSSCYKPTVKLLYDGGYTPIGEATGARLPGIVTLAEGATLDQPTLELGRVSRYTIESSDTNHQLVVIETRGGGRLVVTGNHPLVDGAGYMREASTLAVREHLARVDGSKDEIVRIGIESFFGKVYNVTPEGESLESQIVVAEGFLSGSAWYQNDGAEYLNRDIFRLNLPDELVEPRGLEEDAVQSPGALPPLEANTVHP
ncbi:Hint domain-containing protein [Sorangium sp. So ce362]|uniref:Hint domain-containing protein n=1 Tax=Sorangium sp. So ce362 TaxID=3133303 RepID=UPI003F603EBF